MPFYLLQLYIGVAVLVLAAHRPLSPWRGALVGLGCTLPLVLWSIATHCAPLVQATYLASGALQGGLLAWLATRMAGRTPQA